MYRQEREDYYALLGLAQGASVQDVKSAYRRLAKQYHVDSPAAKKALAQCRTDEEREKLKAEMNGKFTKISTAHSILSDEDKKRRYDNGEDVEGRDEHGADFSDVFDFFGGFGSSRRQQRKCRPRVEKILVTLNDVLRGKKCKYKIPRKTLCSACNAFGSAGSEACKACRGQGTRMEETRMGGTILCRETTCYKCKGAGFIKNGPPCQKCEGRGHLQESTIVEFEIPQGVPEGHKVVYEGMGDQERGLVPGDVVFVVCVKPHPKYTRLNEVHLYTEMEVPLHRLLSGSPIPVGAIDERVIHVELPRLQGRDLGSDLLMVPEEGLPSVHRHKSRGNLYVRVLIAFPARIDVAKMREAFYVTEAEGPAADAVPAEFVRRQDVERIVEEEEHEEQQAHGRGSARQCSTV